MHHLGWSKHHWNRVSSKGSGFCPSKVAFQSWCQFFTSPTSQRKKHESESAIHSMTFQRRFWLWTLDHSNLDFLVISTSWKRLLKMTHSPPEFKNTPVDFGFKVTMKELRWDCVTLMMKHHETSLFVHACYLSPISHGTQPPKPPGPNPFQQGRMQEYLQPPRRNLHQPMFGSC